MAGGGALQTEKKTRGKSKRKKKKRVGFVLDMTPLVDITFLLLTFFMFTTTMAAPQVMDMSLPPEMKTEIEVPDYLLFEIKVRDDGEIFWNIGTEEPKKVESLKELRKIAIRENLKPETKNKLITVLKISDDALYKRAIEILDELNLAEGVIAEDIQKETDEEGNPLKRKRKFTMAELTEEDIEKMENYEEGGSEEQK